MLSMLYPRINHFYWQILLLCLFSQAIQCIPDAPHEGHWGSLLLPRATPNGGELVNFDDMPNCAREDCYPYKASQIGCSDSTLTKECFCAHKDNIYCAQSSCNEGERNLLNQWLASTCLGTSLTRFTEVPVCASKCIWQANVFKSCSLKSWDCFCVTNLYEDCLTTCSEADKQRMEAWKTEECVSYNSFQKTTTSVAEPSASSRSTVSVVTDSSAQRPTSTANPTPGAIIAGTSGDAQGLFSETAM